MALAPAVQGGLGPSEAEAETETESDDEGTANDEAKPDPPVGGPPPSNRAADMNEFVRAVSNAFVRQQLAKAEACREKANGGSQAEGAAGAAPAPAPAPDLAPALAPALPPPPIKAAEEEAAIQLTPWHALAVAKAVAESRGEGMEAGPSAGSGQPGTNLAPQQTTGGQAAAGLAGLAGQERMSLERLLKEQILEKKNFPRLRLPWTDEVRPRACAQKRTTPAPSPSRLLPARSPLCPPRH